VAALAALAGVVTNSPGDKGGSPSIDLSGGHQSLVAKLLCDHYYRSALGDGSGSDSFLGGNTSQWSQEETDAALAAILSAFPPPADPVAVRLPHRNAHQDQPATIVCHSPLAFGRHGLRRAVVGSDNSTVPEPPLPAVFTPHPIFDEMEFDADTKMMEAKGGGSGGKPSVASAFRVALGEATREMHAQLVHTSTRLRNRDSGSLRPPAALSAPSKVEGQRAVMKAADSAREVASVDDATGEEAPAAAGGYTPTPPSSAARGDAAGKKTATPAAAAAPRGRHARPRTPELAQVKNPALAGAIGERVRQREAAAAADRVAAAMQRLEQQQRELDVNSRGGDGGAAHISAVGANTPAHTSRLAQPPPAPAPAMSLHARKGLASVRQALLRAELELAAAEGHVSL
jgi:hypothetical protein